MYKLTTSEYKQTEYFKNIQRFLSPAPDRLLKYRRNVIGLGAFVLFFYFAGINIEGFSGGFIKGTIEKPYLVSMFLCLFFTYNYFMFYVHLNKEIERHDFTVNNILSFGTYIAKFIIIREIAKIIKISGISIGNSGYEPKNFSVITSSENNIRTSFTLDLEIRKANEKEIRKLSGFEIDKNVIIFDYEMSEEDKKYYSENSNLIKQAVINEYMDYLFPKYFGVFVLMVIAYKSINAI